VWSAAPEGERAPALVPLGEGYALRFERERGTLLDLGQGEGGALRMRGALSLVAVVRMDAVPPGKVSLISKWRLTRGGRSFELGLTASRQLFFTISASGTWPERARELLSTRQLEPGEIYLVAATFEPDASMALYVNGAESGRIADRIPGEVFDSETPVLLGNRPGAEDACAFDGIIGGAWFHPSAPGAEALARAAAELGLDRPPPPELELLEPPYDLDAVRERTRDWYRRLQAPGEPYGAYRMRPGSPPDLYASADVAWIRWIQDDLDLEAAQRREWIAYIGDQQDPGDGSYRHLTGHCATHAFCHATGALNMLGGRQRHRPALLDAYLDVEGVPAWLDGIDWVNQWGASHDVWGAGVPLVCTPSTPVEWTEAVFGWLDAEADPGTGFWRRGVEASSPMQYLGGAFHIWPLYAALERPIPHPERVIDGVLALQRPSGSFGGGFDYGNMDGVWVLQYLCERTDWRREEVLEALERNLHGLMEVYNRDPGRFFSSAHSTESRIATLAMLQAALPEAVRSALRWRNPWHRRELFAILCRGD